MFVVRTAGHVVDTTVIGSIEYAVEILRTPLIVVLGHDKCGAVHAAAEALATGIQPDGFVRAVTDRIIPSIVTMTSGPGSIDTIDENQLRTEHVKHTVSMIHSYSALVSRAVAEGRCAIIGLEYDLEDGQARLINTIGNVDVSA